MVSLPVQVKPQSFLNTKAEIIYLFSEIFKIFGQMIVDCCCSLLTLILNRKTQIKISECLEIQSIANFIVAWFFYYELYVVHMMKRLDYLDAYFSGFGGFGWSKKSLVLIFANILPLDFASLNPGLTLNVSTFYNVKND